MEKSTSIMELPNGVPPRAVSRAFYLPNHLSKCGFEKSVQELPKIKGAITNKIKMIVAKISHQKTLQGFTNPWNALVAKQSLTRALHDSSLQHLLNPLIQTDLLISCLNSKCTMKIRTNTHYEFA